MSVSLKEFCSKSNNKELANETVRCGSCQNILLHCGKYEFEYINSNRKKLAVFLAIVIVAGIIAVLSPSFIVGA